MSWPTCSDIPIEEIASNCSPDDVAVVLEPDLHPISDTRFCDTLPGELRLCLADRDADHACVVVERSVNGHRPPPTSDFEQARAGVLVQSQLATDEVMLGRLRILQREVWLGEPRAGIRQRRPENQTVEVVADVVVVPDRAGVAPE